MANLSQLRSRVVTYCSLVIAPVDIWTRRIPAPSALTISLSGVHKRPMRKLDGTYIFLDLPKGIYELKITSPTFIPFTQIVDTSELPPMSPVITVPLLPGTAYSYPAIATAIAFRLLDAAGNQIANADVEAYAVEESTARGRISHDTFSAGEDQVTVGSQRGLSVAGESLLLCGQGKQELVRIAKTLSGGVLQFEKAIENSYRRGALLLPAVCTSSAQDGSVLLPFRGTLPASFRVKVHVRNEQKSVTAELTACAGQVLTAQTLIF